MSGRMRVGVDFGITIRDTPLEIDHIDFEVDDPTNLKYVVLDPDGQILDGVARAHARRGWVEIDGERREMAIRIVQRRLLDDA